MEAFVRGLPKAELHVHIEGALEPELLFEIARRNHRPTPYASVEEVRSAYRFTDLQSFLDVYYEAVQVLRTERDYYELAWSYLRRATAEGVRHAEIFFDPQSHTSRGVDLRTVLGGLRRALARGRGELGTSSALIPCFLRHLGEPEALETLEELLHFREAIVGVGLDSTELGHPPEKFARVFARARREGLRVVAHAGEEGPPAYVWQALDLLGAERIDHGVRSLEDPTLAERLRRDQVPLTVCPLSNVSLRVFPSLEEHNLRALLEAGLLVTLNSDDPAYFGGYVAANYLAVHEALGLDRAQLCRLAGNSFRAAFLDEDAKRDFLAEVDAYAEAGFVGR